MKIAWFCIPAYGHTNPTLGLVRELTAAGHEVYYFSFEMFRGKLERAGARFIACDGCEMQMKDADNADRVGKDLAFATELIVKTTLSLDDMLSKQIEAIHPDLIVGDSVAYWGKLAALKFGIPFVSSTTTFAFNRFSARYMEQSTGGLLKLLLSMPKINRQLSLLREKGYPVKSVLDIIQNDNETNTIVYTSRLFQPCAETFSERYRFIGPSIRSVETPMEKTAEKTVYVSMGTVSRNPAFYRNCVEVLKGMDCQAILSMGANRERFDDLPECIRVYEHVDQMAVLSIADAFLTHCGMNSASEGLYFRVPLVLFPQTSEQGAVAKRVEELGAGVRLRSTAPADIAAALHTALDDPSYRSNAAKVSDSFRACGGAVEARAFLESLFNG